MDKQRSQVLADPVPQIVKPNLLNLTSRSDWGRYFLGFCIAGLAAVSVFIGGVAVEQLSQSRGAAIASDNPPTCDSGDGTTMPCPD